MLHPHATKLELATLGGGCFWCLDAAYRQISGVASVVSGYSGGTRPNPTYVQVCSGATGHAEVVQVKFDRGVINYSDILDIFFTIHDPTQLDRQGYDVGTEYRSVIFFHDDAQKSLATTKITEIQALWADPIVTQLSPLETFYPAEPEHQNYFANNPSRAYCQIIINPKLAKLREKFAARLRDYTLGA